jgi:hypothetical protein
MTSLLSPETMTITLVALSTSTADAPAPRSFFNLLLLMRNRATIVSCFQFNISMAQHEIDYGGTYPSLLGSLLCMS